MKTKRSKTDRPARWRNYVDLTPSEKTVVRRMYAAGDALMAIAQRLRVYAGTVTTAAESGRWPRAGGVETIARRIATALTRKPTSTDGEIAELVGCNPSYVSTIRHRMRLPRGAVAKRTVKKSR